jgi:hypothetical protein
MPEKIMNKKWNSFKNVGQSKELSLGTRNTLPIIYTDLYWNSIKSLVIIPVGNVTCS